MYKEILGGDTDGTAAHVLTEQLSGKSLTSRNRKLPARVPVVAGNIWKILSREESIRIGKFVFNPKEGVA